MPDQAFANVLRTANLPLITPEEDQAQISAQKSWSDVLGNVNVPFITADENDEQTSQTVGALRAASDASAANADDDGQDGASPAATHVYDGPLKKIYSVDSHRRLLSARNEPHEGFWTSWHDHLFDLQEAKQGEAN